MVPEGMTLLSELVKDSGMFFDIISDNKEGGLCPVLIQNTEDLGSNAGDGTIIKRNIDDLFLTANITDKVFRA